MTQTFEFVSQIQGFVTWRYLPIPEGYVTPPQTTRPSSVRSSGSFERKMVNRTCSGFEVFTAETVKSTAFRPVTPCIIKTHHRVIFSGMWRCIMR